IGREPGLVQPGGGNTSIKLGDVLLVKASGTDLRTIGRDGFARLSLPELAALGSADAMSDAEMMRFMTRCALPPDGRGPAPSVETPLHSLLPHRVIAHTHDVATMSLTNLTDATAERLVRVLLRGEIVYVPYVRPGSPLPGAMRGMLGSPPDGRVILHFDDDDDILTTLAAERLPALAHRGMATPEHILRAGRLPLWLDLDPSAPVDRLLDAVRTQLAQQRSEY